MQTKRQFPRPGYAMFVSPPASLADSRQKVSRPGEMMHQPGSYSLKTMPVSGLSEKAQRACLIASLRPSLYMYVLCEANHMWRSGGPIRLSTQRAAPLVFLRHGEIVGSDVRWPPYTSDSILGPSTCKSCTDEKAPSSCAHAIMKRTETSGLALCRAATRSRGTCRSTKRFEDAHGISMSL